jgi:hypothetical protein
LSKKFFGQPPLQIKNKKIMKKIFTLFIFIWVLNMLNISAQTTIYSENFGSPSGNTNVNSYTGWSNTSVTYTGDGTCDVRSTSSSTTVDYATASGLGNVMINNTTKWFQVSGINTAAYSNLKLSFGLRKGTSAETGSNFIVEVSTNNGTNFTRFTFNTLPNGAKYFYVTIDDIPAAENLILKFRESASVEFRLDDLLIIGTIATPPASDDATLSSLKVDNVTVAEFNSTTYTYSHVVPFSYSGIPTVTATANSTAATVQITQATAIPGAATVLVTAEDGTTQKTYTVNFTKAAPNPVLTVSPASLPFGEVMLTTAPAGKTITVSGSELTANITYTIEGDASAFAVEETSWTAAAGGTLTVTFTPAAIQTYTATLKISSAGAADKTVNLTGEGIPYAVIISEWKGYPDATVTSGSTTYVHPEAGTDANMGNADLTISGAIFETGVAGSVSGTFAPNSKAWDGELSTDKYWQVTFNTEGYDNLKVTSKQQGSNTGPKDFKIQYLNGDSWTDLTGGTITVANNFTVGVVKNLELPAALADKEEVSLRWLRTSTTSINNGTVAPGGTNRIEITITGDEIILSSDATLSDLKVNFETIPGFSPDVTEYDYELPPYIYEVMPMVEATANDEAANLEITQTNAIPGSATVLVTAADGTTLTYTINFTQAPAPELDADTESLVFTTTGEEKTVTVTAAHLLEKITITSDNPAFTVTPNELPVSTTSGTFTVKFTGSSNTTGTVTVESSDISLDIDLEATVVVGLQPINGSAAFVYTGNNTLFVKNITSTDRIQVYDFTGKLIRTATNTTAITLPSKGIYLVRVNSEVFKVINK